MHRYKRAFLKMEFLFVAIVLLLLVFASVDVWYFTRFVIIYYFGTRNRRDQVPKEDITRTYVTRNIVLPSDIDIYMHMNNAKYLREFDLSRMNMMVSNGCWEVFQKNGAFILVNAGNIRYRRPMKLFQRYTIETQLVGWDDSTLYAEQRMKTSDGFVTAILFSKHAIRGISVGEIMKELYGEVIPSPELSPEMKAWLSSVEISSKKLRAEAGLSKTPSFKDVGTISLQR